MFEDVQTGVRNRSDHSDPGKEEPPEEMVAWEEHDQSCPLGSSQGSHGLASRSQQPPRHLLPHSRGPRVLKGPFVQIVFNTKSGDGTVRKSRQHWVCQPPRPSKHQGDQRGRT